MSMVTAAVTSGAAGVARRLGFALVGSGRATEIRQHRLHRVGRLPAPYTDVHRTHPVPFEIDLDRVTTPCGFSYAPGGWHPYVAALEERLANPGLPYERSVLCRYYARFQPRSVQEALAGDTEEPLPPLDRWPPVPKLYKHLWTLTPARVERILAESVGWEGRIKQHVGPQTREQALGHLARLLDVHRSVRERGYDPAAYRDGVITGYFLEDRGEVRFMVILGNHRLAAFRVAGVERVQARLHPGHPPVVNADRLDRWSRRAGGVLTPEVARRVFAELFSEDGDRKARRLGIV
jgi:hypothetical protein